MLNIIINKKILLIPAIISIIVVFIACGFTIAVSASDDISVDDLNKQIDEQRNKIEELTKKIEEYKNNINSNRQEALSLKNQISIIDNQIGKTDLELQLKEEEAKELQLKIDQTNNLIKEIETQTGLEKDKLSEIIRLMSRYDDQDYLSILLANESFSDFFDQVKYSADLQKNLQKTVNKLKESKEKLNEENKKLAVEKDSLSEILNKLESTKDILSRQKGDKNKLVTATQKSEKKFQLLVEDLKKEQAAANAQVASLEKKLRDSLAKKGDKEKFNSLSNAALVWPTTSRRITATFYDPTYPYRNLFEHSGIDLGVPQGTPVKSAEAGYVAKVALGTKWYGNYIMIIHGGNITTLYAHLKSVNVAQDQYVGRGELIGYSGSTGFSSGPHLHFEVRANGIPVNPLNYLP